VLLLVLLSAPWAFGGVLPFFQWWLALGLATALGLAVVVAALERRLIWHPCPVLGWLLALVVLTLGQLLPLPPAVVGILSPTTAQHYRNLYPNQPETLTTEQNVSRLPPTMWTLSVDADLTRDFLTQLLTLVALYYLTHNYWASRRALVRLAWLSLANGVALAIFGLGQSASAASDVVYWRYASVVGAVFGPFVNRNHYAFYQNLTLGLCVALFWLAAPRSAPTIPQHEHWADRLTRLAQSPLLILQSPLQLGILLASSVIAVSILFCLSRAGWLALMGSSLIPLAFWVRQRGGASWWSAGIWGLLAVVLLGSGLGWERVEARLRSFTKAGTLQTERWQYWSEVAPLATEFPLWGTGGGTFRRAEVLQRINPQLAGVMIEYAHNEYLEALIEGGVVRLGITIALLAVVFYTGLRTAFRTRSQTTQALLIGGLMSLLAVALHSIADFGIHMPAIALLTTVVAAMVMAVTDAPEPMRISRKSPRTGIEQPLPITPPEPPPAFTGGTAVVAGVGLLTLGGLLVREAGLNDRAQRYLVSAKWLEAPIRATPTDPALRAERRALLVAGCQCRPQSAYWHLLAGDAFLADGQAEQAQAQRPLTLATTLLLLGTPIEGGMPVAVPLVAPPAPSAQELLRTAASHYRAARNLCPLLPEPHARLAVLTNVFAQADPVPTYLNRAKRLSPADADLPYFSGVELLRLGQTEAAWADWRRSLELDPRHLSAIWTMARARLGAVAASEQVLPPHARLFLLVAEQTADPAERKVLNARAYELLRTQPAQTPAEWFRVGQLCRQLERPDEAVRAFRTALDRELGRAEWRWEFALYLEELDRLSDAEQETGRLLSREPTNPQYLGLRALIRRQLELQAELK
jgi:tetratricopeptide (TPR) repeat protein